MIDLATCLRHYKKKWVQEELLKTAVGREVAVRFNTYMGKRPDTLEYERDVLEFAKKGASSFHISEERWSNPLQLSPNMSKKDLENLRAGWDLIIDIDFVHWKITKLITEAMIKSLKRHGIRSISAKFSGNKGFHIGVPFEAFPENVESSEDLELRNLFPDVIKRIVEYLIYDIDNEGNGYQLTHSILELGEEAHEFLEQRCSKCDTPKVVDGTKFEFNCSSCGYSLRQDNDEDFRKCPKCGSLMERTVINLNRCSSCGNDGFEWRFNFQVDTLLISQRHLYRSVFSLHEKSNKVSVPVDPDNIPDFEKEMADPDKLPAEIDEYYEKFRFLDDSKTSSEEGKALLKEAYDFHTHKEIKNNVFNDGLARDRKKKFDYTLDSDMEKIPMEFFPPAISKILGGLEDGRKRALFILITFLRSVGWEKDEVEKLIDEWNKKNSEPLRETYVKSQIRHQFSQKNVILPPNYNNKMYYQDLAVLSGDDPLESRVKNPVQYAKVKFKANRKNNKAKKQVMKSKKDSEKKEK